MKKRLNVVIATIACLLITQMIAFAQLPTPTYGWNLANTMEPPGGEGTWNNPRVTRQMINAVAGAGFNTIRIPIAWNSHANQRTLQIYPAWMARVKQVVDWSRAANLTVIINCHWDNGWFQDCGFRRFDSKINGKVESYWTQIANTFQNYDARLIFACANEPSVDSKAKTTVLLQYYQTFVNAVRATGGNNTSRWLVIQGPATNIDRTYNWLNTLPSDSTPSRLMVEVHYYDPYNFAMMCADESWGNMAYFWGQGYHSAAMPMRNSKWGEEDYLLSQLQKMKTKFVDQGITVILGEFGSMRRAGYSDLTGIELSRHLASRTYYYDRVVDFCNQNGIKPIYWDEGWAGQDGRALFDRNTAQIIDADSVRPLTGGAPLLPP